MSDLILMPRELTEDQLRILAPKGIFRVVVEHECLFCDPDKNEYCAFCGGSRNDNYTTALETEAIVQVYAKLVELLGKEVEVSHDHK